MTLLVHSCVLFPRPWAPEPRDLGILFTAPELGILLLGSFALGVTSVRPGREKSYSGWEE